MTELLTTRDVQELIKVDKSTIYRMAEDGRIPAIKVGRQWRFPEDAIGRWLATGRPTRATDPEATPARPDSTPAPGLRSLLPREVVQAVSDLVADVLGTMVVITDMHGVPVAEISNPCGLFDAVRDAPGTLPGCVRTWRDFANDLDLAPVLRPSHLGFLCARGFARVDSGLAGMVIAGGVASDDWPPPAARLAQIAAELGVDPVVLTPHVDQVFHLDAAQQRRVVELLPRVGLLISQLVQERSRLVHRLEAIATLAGTPAAERSPS